MGRSSLQVRGHDLCVTYTLWAMARELRDCVLYNLWGPICMPQDACVLQGLARVGDEMYVFSHNLTSHRPPWFKKHGRVARSSQLDCKNTREIRRFIVPIEGLSAGSDCTRSHLVTVPRDVCVLHRMNLYSLKWKFCVLR